MTTQELTTEQLLKGIVQMQDIITQALQVQPQLLEFRKELQKREEDEKAKEEPKKK